MADLTMTVRNTLRLYGVEPHNKWGVLVWGTDVWGERDVEWTDYKYVPNTMTVSSTNAFRVSHLIQENVTLDTIVSRQFPAWIYEGISVSSRISSIYRLNNGWYSQEGDTINALSFPVDGFTEVTDPATTWSQVASPSTTWVQS